MNQPVFDTEAFIEFNLDNGKIYSVGKEQLALVPPDVLAALEPGDRLNEASRCWGKVHGERLAEGLAETDDSVEVGVLAEHLCGTAATLGMGRLSVEIYGNALMFQEHSEEDQTTSRGCDSLLGGFLSGYLSALVPDSFDVLPLGRIGGKKLFWAGNPDAVNQVRLWIEDGIEPFAAIGRLSEGSA
ncbi:MAG: hypothetical protein GY847_30965 [Proteobacteria bacterium]|nr:hypothetical protein [Pseudomonadota bacterium]